MPTIRDNNKRIAKNTLLLYFRMLLTMCISIYTSRVVLHVLGEVDFGIYNVVGGFVSMFAVISGAMTTATQRFLSFEIGKGTSGRVHEVFSTAVMVHLLLGLIILIAGETTIGGTAFINDHISSLRRKPMTLRRSSLNMAMSHPVMVKPSRHISSNTLAQDFCATGSKALVKLGKGLEQSAQRL